MNRAVLSHADVAIVGAGPVGALLALRLARAGRTVQVFEARERGVPVRDARALALSSASLAWLREACEMADVPQSVIDTVHVSQQGGVGRVRLDCADLGLEHLGAVIDYPALVAALSVALARAGVVVHWGSPVDEVRTMSRYALLRLADGQLVSARLAVLADGGPLAETLPGIRRHVHDYQQSALLCELRFDRPAGAVAYERFTEYGPLALLPHGDAFMLVWTRSHSDAAELAQAPAALAAQLRAVLGDRLGVLQTLGPVSRFALALRQLNRVRSGRVLMVGNAAQTMHPVAAQGLNLGLRDADTLARVLAGAPDPGADALLARYVRARRVDSHAVVGFTHGLIRLLEPPSALLGAARGVGLTVLDTVAPLRRRFAGHLVYGVGT